MRSVSLPQKALLWLGLGAVLFTGIVVVEVVVDRDVDLGFLLALLLAAGAMFGLGLWMVHGLTQRWQAVSNHLTDVATGRVTGKRRKPKMEPELAEIWRWADELGQKAAKANVPAAAAASTKAGGKDGFEFADDKQRLEAFLQSIGDGISIVDREMSIVFMNEAMRGMFGDRLGENCYRVYENKSEICPGCPVLKAMETGEVHHSLRRAYDRRGNLIYFESTGSAIRDAKGRIVGGLELARDATRRIKLERNVEIRSRQLSAANIELRGANQQLARAYADLQQAHIERIHAEKMASLGVLVSGIAHEINNPLNFVAGSSKLLNEHLRELIGLLDSIEDLDLPTVVREKIQQRKQEVEYDFLVEDLEKIAKNINTGADRMKGIVQNLRSFSRVDRGHKEEFNVRDGLESTLQILHHQYKDRISIQRDFQPTSPIICSPGQVNQVFMNILHNSIQAIEGTGKINVAIREVDSGVRVSITDSGPGIHPDELGQVFDPFFTTKKVGEGTGLGLSISYGIVEAHGGRLWVASEPGKGSTFHIDLPRRAVDDKTKGN